MYSCPDQGFFDHFSGTPINFSLNFGPGSESSRWNNAETELIALNGKDE
jgi:hypothetical protein